VSFKLLSSGPQNDKDAAALQVFKVGAQLVRWGAGKSMEKCRQLGCLDGE
jgi:hypothetical protein